METQNSSCTLPNREALLRAYLEGTISDADADRFEAHCMTCEECAAELEHGVEMRAALGVARGAAPVTAAAARMPAGRRMDWRWLAAAASIVIAVSIWKFVGSERAGREQAASDAVPASTPSSTPSVTGAPSPVVQPPVATSQPARPATSPNRGTRGDTGKLRNTATGLSASATREPDGAIQLTWTPVDAADRYVVTIFAVTGVQLLSLETFEPHLQISAANSAFGGHADEKLFARVDAKDALGAPIASVDRVTIPARREEMWR